jgi:pilus assembly protein CpaE
VVQLLSVSASSNILFVDPPESADPLTTPQRSPEVCAWYRSSSLIGQVNDVRPLTATRFASGIHDYLLKPHRRPVARHLRMPSVLPGLRGETQVETPRHDRRDRRSRWVGA